MAKQAEPSCCFRSTPLPITQTASRFLRDGACGCLLGAQAKAVLDFDYEVPGNEAEYERLCAF